MKSHPIFDRYVLPLIAGILIFIAAIMFWHWREYQKTMEDLRESNRRSEKLRERLQKVLAEDGLQHRRSDPAPPLQPDEVPRP